MFVVADLHIMDELTAVLGGRLLPLSDLLILFSNQIQADRMSHCLPMPLLY